MRYPLAALPILALSGLAHAQWTVTILHPAAAGQSSALGCSDSQQVGFTFTASDQAALWSGTAASFINLHPTDATESHAIAAANGIQVGDAFVSSQLRASLWTGSAASWTDLSPAGTFRSQAANTDGVRQVGVARVGLFDHAGFWTGTAASWTDLHPATASTSNAYGLGGPRIVGSAIVDNVLHACLWTGTPASFVDIHPTAVSATGSVALATDGSMIAGYAAGVGGHASHACVWTGPSAGAFIDLNPAASTESQALDCGNGDIQVGYVRISNGQSVASLWRGTAASWEDISVYLPGSWVATRAERIAPLTTPGTTRIVGHGFNLTTNRREAVLWTRCYANCDSSSVPPILNANDFQCFLNKFAAGNAYANCDGSTTPPIFNANDFQCFLNLFAAGCP